MPTKRARSNNTLNTPEMHRSTRSRTAANDAMNDIADVLLQLAHPRHSPPPQRRPSPRRADRLRNSNSLDALFSAFGVHVQIVADALLAIPSMRSNAIRSVAGLRTRHTVGGAVYDLHVKENPLQRGGGYAVAVSSVAPNASSHIVVDKTNTRVVRRLDFRHNGVTMFEALNLPSNRDAVRVTVPSMTPRKKTMLVSFITATVVPLLKTIRAIGPVIRLLEQRGAWSPVVLALQNAYHNFRV